MSKVNQTSFIFVVLCNIFSVLSIDTHHFYFDFHGVRFNYNLAEQSECIHYHKDRFLLQLISQRQQNKRSYHAKENKNS